MKYLRLWADADGISHFSDEDMPLRDQGFAPPAPPMPVSDTLPATGTLFLTLPKGWTGAQHPTPKRQFGFCLAGQMKVEAGDGDVRIISAGGIWLMEDTTGQGHVTTVIGDEDVHLAIVQLG